MASAGWLILPLLALLQLTFSSAHGNLAATPVHCLPDQAASLLQLKKSFSFDYSTTTLPSWQAGTNCCLWEGIGCDASSGQVTALSLGGQGLYSKGINGALFNLTSLKHLDLSGNDFGGLRLPVVGFERLSLLTHLNLSTSAFCGQIPISIGYLTGLISLDLSNQLFRHPNTYNWNRLVLWEPSFTALVSNLRNLWELYLDWVDISASGDEWCSALARHVPRLEILSLEGCSLYGPIHPSLSRVHSLTMINLDRNFNISGAVPDLFADFLNLSVLRLVFNNFDGLFPPRIFQLKNLRVLDVSNNQNLLGRLPDFLNGSSLEILNIVETSISTGNPSSLSNLKSLKELSIGGKHTWLRASSFKSLQTLYLSQLESESSFSWIGDLKSLKNLEINNCNFSARTPSWIGNLRSLRNLIMYSCSFSGSIPSAIGNLKNLEGLWLQDCNFSGRIPDWLANFTQLIDLDLGMNHLSGEIPDFLFTLPALQYLDLSSNQLSGQLREFPTSSSPLASIILNENELGGSIPHSFFQLKSLGWLDLGYNNFTGQVELDSLLRLKNLKYINLSNNKLSLIDGQAISLATMPRLRYLNLASCSLTKIPDSLQLLHYIAYLDISNNHISGSIPKWMWDNWSDRLKYLNLSHNMFSSMDLSSTFLRTYALDTLDLSSNRLQGEICIPQKLANYRFLDYSNNRFTSIMKNCTSCLSQTSYLKMSNNRISGQIPHFISNASNLQFLDLSNNSFSGQIPHFICNTSKLQVLDLSHNSFSGTIPPCLMENGQLSILNLGGNHLEGRLATSIDKGCALQTVNLDGNRIEGHLPRSLTNCTDLEFLDVGNNQIVDSFPYWLGNLPKLRVLVLRSNQFHGSIGNSQGDDDYGEYFSSLQIIDVASNNLSSNLSSQWFEKLESMIKSSNFTGDIIEAQTGSQGSYETFEGEYIALGSYQNIVTVMFKGQYITFEKIWTTLTMIDFSDNAFRGVIPESIGKLARLHGLNLSHNMLTREIPSQLGGMTDLESLDLSSNELSGEIPEELVDLTSLGTLNLSNNQLMGKIPELRQFGTFQNNSYEGNVGLCGAPLSKQCGSAGSPVEASGTKPSDHVDVILFLFVGIGFGLGFAAGLLIKWGRIGKWYKKVNT